MAAQRAVIAIAGFARDLDRLDHYRADQYPSALGFVTAPAPRAPINSLFL